MELPFRIALAGLDELAQYREARVTHILSILDPDWPAPDALAAFPAHEKLELRFHDVIEEEPGTIAPAPAHIDLLLAFGRALAKEAHLLVHCHAGVSRSSASMALLIAQAAPHRSAGTIFAELLRIRPQIWPNLRIVELGDRALGRNGALIAAAHFLYRAQIDDKPHLFAHLRSGSRGREIEAALAATPPS